MSDDKHDVEDVAVEMIDRFGDGAAHIAREQAEIAAAVPDMASVEAWRNVADAIERLSSNP